MKILAFSIACFLLVVGIYLAKEYQTEQQQREKKAEPVLNWLRANGCQVKKLESGIYRLSWYWWEKGTVDPSTLLAYTWNPRHDSYDDLDWIKQIFQDHKRAVVQN